MIMSYKDEVQLIQQPDLSEPEVPPKDKKFRGYYKISRHYNWALNTTFKYGYDFVIIVEGGALCNALELLNIYLSLCFQMISISRPTFTNTSSERSRCCELTRRSGASRLGTTTARKASLTMQRQSCFTAQTSSLVSVG